jgi:hypothetical protein
VLAASVLFAARASLILIQPAPIPGAGGQPFQDSARRQVEATQPTAQRPAAAQAAKGGKRARLDSLSFGARTIGAGSTVRGPVVVAGGNLEVRGTVQGDVIAIFGDVVVPAGGRVTGDAVSIFGEVRSAGTVGGEAVTLVSAVGGAFTEAESAPKKRDNSTSDALRLSLAWLFVVLLIGVGVLLFAAPYLDGVVDVLEDSFWRSLGVGVAGGVALIPALLLVIAGLAVTIVGVLLIPFAVVAYVLAAAGLVTLGFLAVARVTGHSVGSTATTRLSARGSALRALILGVVIYLGLWVIASVFAWSPVISTILRLVAFAITCVAATAGFGAAILSRAGTRRELPAGAPAAAADAVAWQTPTPITGVVAARRPSAASGARERR